MRAVWIAVAVLVVIVASALAWSQAPPTANAVKRIEAVLRDPTPPDEPTAYAHCASCHLHDGTGRPDGSIPRLNGQRRAVLERKLHRIRSGETWLPVMAPFARTLTPAEISEVASYLAELPDRAPTPVEADPIELRAGAEAYAAHCASCHGAHAEGHDGLGASRLCGQYAGYLQRRLEDMSAGTRGAGDAIMTEVLDGVPAETLVSIVAWLASDEGCAR